MSEMQLFLIIALSTGGGALFLYYYGLKRLSASVVTVFELSWPLSAIFFDWYLYANILSYQQIFFSCLLLFSFFMIFQQQKKAS